MIWDDLSIGDVDSTQQIWDFSMQQGKQLLESVDLSSRIGILQTVPFIIVFIVFVESYKLQTFFDTRHRQSRHVQSLKPFCFLGGQLGKSSQTGTTRKLSSNHEAKVATDQHAHLKDPLVTDHKLSPRLVPSVYVQHGSPWVGQKIGGHRLPQDSMVRHHRHRHNDHDPSS